MLVATAVLGLVLGAQVETAPPVPEARLLVWAFETPDAMDPALTAALTDGLTDALRRSGEFATVHSSVEVQDILQRTPSERLAQCTSCLESAQRVLAVSHVLVGRLSWVGGRLAVSLKLVDTTEAAVVASVLELVSPGDEETLLRFMDRLASRLLVARLQRALQDTVDGTLAAP